MQNALLAAQKTCDQMVADAEKKCAQMLHEAEDAASAKTNNVDALVGEEQERLDAAKAATSQFLDGMEKRLKRQLELIDELRRETPLTPSQPEEPERVHRFTPPVEPQTPVLTPKEQPKEPSHNRAYDYEAEQSHPSAEGEGRRPHRGDRPADRAEPQRLDARRHRAGGSLRRYAQARHAARLSREQKI